VVARYADVWNYSGASVDEFKHKIAVLHEHCAAVGRDPKEITLSYQYRLKGDDLSPAVGELEPFIEAGATHIVIILPAPYPDGIVTRVAEEVVAKFTA
jgi:hypothetical protein